MAGVKKKCCRSTPKRCRNGPVVAHRVSKIEKVGLTGTALTRAVQAAASSEPIPHLTGADAASRDPRCAGAPADVLRPARRDRRAGRPAHATHRQAPSIRTGLRGHVVNITASVG
jgi:hypothetical protein